MDVRIGRLVVLALAIAFAVSPLFSDGFGGFYPESFPVQVDRWPAQPEGWAFSIWGLIYLALIVTAGWAVLRPDAMPGWDRAILPLGISLLIGVFWIVAATNSPILATAMIVPMAVLAILAMCRVGPGFTEWAAVGLYAGWLTAASGVALSVVLTGYGVLGPRVAAISLIVGVLVVALGVAALRPQVLTYRAGVIWALIGVVAANLAEKDWLIVALCAVGILGLAGLNWVMPKSALAR